MHLNCRAVPAIVLAAVLAAGAAGCGSAGSASTGSASTGNGAAPKPSAGKDPLAGLGSQQVLTRAVTDTETAASVHMHIASTDSGKKLTVDSTMIHGKGCEGTMAETGQGTAAFVYDGTTMWLNGDTTFWKANGGSSPTVLSLFADKYIKTTSKSLISGFAQFCDLKSLLGGFSSSGASGMPQARTTVSGQPAVELKDTADSAAVYVSDSVKPVMLAINAPGSGGGDMSFSAYDAATALTLPPAGEVVDGSKYGM